MFRLYVCGHLQAGCRTLNKKTTIQYYTMQYNSGGEIWSLYQSTIIQEYIKFHGNISTLQKSYIKLRGLYKNFKYFYTNCAAKVIVAVQDKWAVVRLFEQSHCRFFEGTLLCMGFCYQ